MIIHKGPSLLDGKNIVVIATDKSKNRKLKDVVQVWILLEDVEPHIAVKTGEDVSICGNCPQRHYTGGGCYVLPFQAPLAVYRAYKRGSYPEKDLSKLKGKKIRFGSYGDPAAVPVSVWKELAEIASEYTGYTHQIKHKNFDPEILNYCMASLESPKQAKQDIRHFRVRPKGSPLLTGEINCPGECPECMLCNGGTKGPSISIEGHGSYGKRIKMVAVQ